MTEPRFGFKNSRWAGNEHAPGWDEELERRGPENTRDHLRERLSSGSSGDIKFGGMPSEFVEDWLASHENAQRRLQREHVENERVIARWTRTLGRFTRALAAIGALALLTSILTALILYWTDQTSKLRGQTSKLRDRAFLYFGDPHVTQYPPNDPIVWSVSITVTNAGNMPARRVKVWYSCPDAPSAESVQDPFRLAAWANANIGSVLGPKQSVELQGCNVPIGVISDAKKSLRTLYYVVQAQYTDGFDDKTVTQASRVFGFDQWGGQSLQFTGTHNCSDDDCPQ